MSNLVCGVNNEVWYGPLRSITTARGGSARDKYIDVQAAARSQIVFMIFATMQLFVLRPLKKVPRRILIISCEKRRSKVITDGPANNRQISNLGIVF